MAKFDQIHPNVKKTYKCNQCGFSSNAPSMLKNHMRVHSGEEPGICHGGNLPLGHNDIINMIIDHYYRNQRDHQYL